MLLASYAAIYTDTKNSCIGGYTTLHALLKIEQGTVERQSGPG